MVKISLIEGMCSVGVDTSWENHFQVNLETKKRNISQKESKHKNLKPSIMTYFGFQMFFPDERAWAEAELAEILRTSR